MNWQRPVRIAAAVVVEDHVLRLTFTDDTVRDVDVGPLLHGPIFEPMRNDPAEFRKVTVDPEWGTVVWPTAPTSAPTFSTSG